jgi:hypothetical protein
VLVPVLIAAEIGERCCKDIVIVLSWDAWHNLTHTTTWGRRANDKLVAAEAGNLVAAIFGADVDQKRVYEDFRLDSARLKEENDRLKLHLAHLLTAAKELIALIDEVPADPTPGLAYEENDRVFPRYEFEPLRAAILGAESKEVERA